MQKWEEGRGEKERGQRNKPEPDYKFCGPGFTTKYRCIFATSHNHFVDGPARVFVPESTTQNVYYRGVGGLASAGVPGLLFWFMYLPIVESNDEQDEEVGAASYTYTDADCEAALAQHGHRRLGPNYTFRDLYDSRVRPPVMTAMEEGVVRARWNSGGRVVLLGDAVHKVCTIHLLELDKEARALPDPSGSLQTPRAGSVMYL